MPTAPPPILKFRVESGDPTVVHVDYDGETYDLSLVLSVMSVSPMVGQTTPDGLPQFNVQAAPVMLIKKGV